MVFVDIPWRERKRERERERERERREKKSFKVLSD
jgi:hypothetical protein